MHLNYIEHFKWRRGFFLFNKIKWRGFFLFNKIAVIQGSISFLFYKLSTGPDDIHVIYLPWQNHTCTALAYSMGNNMFYKWKVNFSIILTLPVSHIMSVVTLWQFVDAKVSGTNENQSLFDCHEDWRKGICSTSSYFNLACTKRLTQSRQVQSVHRWWF